jgi:hypothetical protein
MEFGVLFTPHPNHVTEPYPHRDVHARVTAEIQAADRLYDTAWAPGAVATAHANISPRALGAPPHWAPSYPGAAPPSSGTPSLLVARVERPANAQRWIHQVPGIGRDRPGPRRGRIP